jgi:hypothetical protein
VACVTAAHARKAAQTIAASTIPHANSRSVILSEAQRSRRIESYEKPLCLIRDKSSAVEKSLSSKTERRTPMQKKLNSNVNTSMI